jgi:curved DNA-binding protein CbpA
MEVSYRETLGVSSEATFQEIRKAFLTKVRELHPDKGGDPETFRKFYEAYQGLKEITKQDKQRDISSGGSGENEEFESGETEENEENGGSGDEEPEKWWEWMTWMGRWMKRMAKGGDTLRMKIAWNYIGKTIQFEYDNFPVEVCLDAPMKQVQGGLRIQVIPIIQEPDTTINVSSSSETGKSIQTYWNEHHWLYILQKTEDHSGGFQIKGGHRLLESETSGNIQIYSESPLIQVLWI